MRSCEEYQAWASCLIDGELDAERERELRQHAAHCEECRAVLDAFTALSDSVEDALVEPPETLHENVMAEIRRENIKPVPRPAFRFRRQWAAAAGLAVVLLAGLSIAQRNRAAEPAAGVMTAAAPVEEAAMVAEESKKSYAVAEAEIANDNQMSAAGSAMKAAENGIRYEDAAADRSTAAEPETRELTADQAETLLAALGDATDESPIGEPLLLTWPDVDGVLHTAELWDNVCIVEGDCYTLTGSKTVLLERLFDSGQTP